MFAITTAVLIGTIVILSWISMKLLAVLVGALLLYFCPIIFLMMMVAAGTFMYRKNIMRKVLIKGRER